MRRAASAAARLARRASPFSSSDAWAISDVVRLSSGVPRSSLFARGWSDPPVRGYARWVKAILPDGGERWIRDAPSRSPPSDRPGVSSRPRRRPDPRGTFSASGTSSLRDRAPPRDPSHPDFGEHDFNRHLVRTRSPEDVLRAWDAAPPGFDPSFINVSTAVTKLDNRLSRAVRAWRARAHDASGAAPEWAVDLDARVTTAVTDLARDPRFISILRAVIRRAPEFGAQALANVAHGVGDLVGKLGADPRGAVSTETSIGPGEWDRLVRAMSDRFAVDSARLDRELNAQEVANAYNGAAWFPDLAETMGPASWSRLARSVERVHDHLNEQGVSLVLNALANGPHMREASRAMTSEGWRLLAGRATATADRMNEQATSGTVNALAKLSDASDAMDTHGGDRRVAYPRAPRRANGRQTESTGGDDDAQRRRKSTEIGGGTSRDARTRGRRWRRRRVEPRRTCARRAWLWCSTHCGRFRTRARTSPTNVCARLRRAPRRRRTR